MLRAAFSCAATRVITIRACGGRCAEMVAVTVIAAGFGRAWRRESPGRERGLLARILARGDRITLPRSDRGPYGLLPWQIQLLRTIDPVVDARRYASAPVSWLGDGEPPCRSTLLHATPVHLVALSDRLQLARAAALDEASMREIATALGAQLATDASGFEATRTGTLFMHVRDRLDVATVPVESALDMDLRDAMPTGPDAPAIRRLMTEAQMLLHALPFNERRSATGDAPANGLWLWGNGSVPACAPQPGLERHGSGASLRGLARLFVCTLHEASAAHVFECSRRGTRQFAVVEVDDLDGFEQRWLEPLVRALRERSLERVGFGLESGSIEVTRRHMRRFWRRARTWPQA
jgi:hypothetical protein